MNRKLIIIAIAIVLVLIVIGGGLFFFFSNNGAQKETQTSTTEKGMVDCGNLSPENASCFFNRMNTCLPVTAKMTGSDNTTEIDLTILGIENEKCHFQRTVENEAGPGLDCYFPKGTPLTWDLIDQTFGNDKGLQKVVDDSCGLR